MTNSYLKYYKLWHANCFVLHLELELGKIFMKNKKIPLLGFYCTYIDYNIVLYIFLILKKKISCTENLAWALNFCPYTSF